MTPVLTQPKSCDCPFCTKYKTLHSMMRTNELARFKGSQTIVLPIYK